jgi:hypothetical protein
VNERRGSFVERALDGHTRIDQLDAEVSAWLQGPRGRPLHELLGLDADELELIAATPDALRYVLHARRFGRDVPLEDLRGQARIRSHAILQASSVVDPHDLADIESWLPHVDAAASTTRAEREPSHA